MFKLIKILNSCSNVPEPLILPTDGTAIPAGTLLSMSVGYASGCKTDGKPQYVSLSKSCGYSISAYPITHDMVFETEFWGDPNEVYEGDLIGIGADYDGFTTGVNEAGTVFYFMNRNGATKYGDKVIVRPVV